MNRDYHRWYSPILGRDMELLVFGRSGARVLTFPTRLGRFFDYENWGIVSSLRRHIDEGWIQLFCLDSVDSMTLYAWWRHPRERIAHHELYERYVLDEVLSFSGRINPCHFVTALGCSLGAYHAANIVLRHPHRFGKLVALSGRYDLTRPVDHFGDLFDGYYDENHLLPHALPLPPEPARRLASRRDPTPANHLRRRRGRPLPREQPSGQLDALGERGVELPSRLAGPRPSGHRLAADGLVVRLTSRVVSRECDCCPADYSRPRVIGDD